MNNELVYLEKKIESLQKEVQSLQTQLDQVKVHLLFMDAHSKQNSHKQDRIDN